jgi:hypothetical protein
MAAKYGSQVIFGRLDHIAKSMRELQALWHDTAQNCRYRAGIKGSMVVDKDKFRARMCKRDNYVCHWNHCTVCETTEDSVPYHEQGLG